MDISRREAIIGVTASPLAKKIISFAKFPPYDVAVVGSGVFGAWTAWHLAKAGRSVVLIDQYGEGNARSSSGGETRVIRYSYGGDELYSQMAVNSLAQWEALSNLSSQRIFYQTGVLWFSPKGEKYTTDSLAWSDARQSGDARGDKSWLTEMYPMMRFKDDEYGFLERTTGALLAGRGVQAVVSHAQVPQVDMRVDAPGSAGETYKLGDVVARNVVYACGPWLPKLFPEVLGGRIFVTRQEVYHFGLPVGGFPRLPVWADFNGGDIVYGIPDIEGQGFKMAFDRHGPEVDPDTQDRRVSAEGVAEARAYLKRRFPDLADAPLIHSRVCQYENSSNVDFLIDRLPGHDRVWLVGGGSGHGFKHGPEVGRRVARHIIDPATPIEPRFSLATKGKAQKRSVY